MRWFWARLTSLHFSGERGGCGHLLWPWMFLRNFFAPEEQRQRFTASCLILQASSVTGCHCQLLEAADLEEVTGWWLCSSLLILFVGAQICLLLPAGNDARNILSIGLTPLAPHQSRKAGIWLCSFFWRNTFLSCMTVWDGEWKGSSHLLLHPIPSRPMWLHSRIHCNTYQMFPWKPLLRMAKVKLDWINYNAWSGDTCTGSMTGTWIINCASYLKKARNKRYAQNLSWFDSTDCFSKQKEKIKPAASCNAIEIDALPLTLISHQFTPV